MNCQQLYKSAHKLQMENSDLSKAIELYEQVLAQCPGTELANYSKIQINNIKSRILSGTQPPNTLSINDNLPKIYIVAIKIVNFAYVVTSLISISLAIFYIFLFLSFIANNNSFSAYCYHGSPLETIYFFSLISSPFIIAQIILTFIVRLNISIYQKTFIAAVLPLVLALTSYPCF